MAEFDDEEFYVCQACGHEDHPDKFGKHCPACGVDLDDLEASEDLKPSAKLVLTGGENVPAMPMNEAQVNHLRRLLAWMRCEWMLDDDMQRGFISGAEGCVEMGVATPEEAGALLAERAEKINQCPAYVRQAVKMLTKALRDHERAAGILDSRESGNVPL